MIQDLLSSEASLDKMTKIYQKVNFVYKSASEERSNKSKNEKKLFVGDEKGGRTYSISGLSNLRGDTNSLNNRINSMLSLTESGDRINTGEVIIFQNEITTIFQNEISASKKYEYVKANIMEFI